MMSALWGGEGGQMHVNSCSGIVCRRSSVSCVCHVDQDHTAKCCVKLSPLTISLRVNQQQKSKKKQYHFYNSVPTKEPSEGPDLKQAVSRTRNYESIHSTKTKHGGGERRKNFPL